MEGVQVAKMFCKDLFYDSVTEIWKGTKTLYHVMYGDSDEEDLDFRECRKFLTISEPTPAINEPPGPGVVKKSVKTNDLRS